MWAKSKGIVNGYPDGTFGPSNKVTEAQFAIMVSNYFNLQSPSEKLDKFSTAKNGYDLYYDKLAGYSTPLYGYFEHSVRNKPIKRGLVAQVLSYLLNDNANLEESIQYLLDNNITSGQNKKFKNENLLKFYGSTSDLTRGQVVTFLYNLDKNGLNSITPSVNEVFENPNEISLLVRAQIGLDTVDLSLITVPEAIEYKWTSKPYDVEHWKMPKLKANGTITYVFNYNKKDSLNMDSYVIYDKSGKLLSKQLGKVNITKFSDVDLTNDGIIAYGKQMHKLDNQGKVVWTKPEEFAELNKSNLKIVQDKDANGVDNIKVYSSEGKLLFTHTFNSMQDVKVNEYETTSISGKYILLQYHDKNLKEYEYDNYLLFDTSGNLLFDKNLINYNEFEVVHLSNNGDIYIADNRYDYYEIVKLNKYGIEIAKSTFEDIYNVDFIFSTDNLPYFAVFSMYVKDGDKFTSKAVTSFKLYQFN